MKLILTLVAVLPSLTGVSCAHQPAALLDQEDAWLLAAPIVVRTCNCVSVSQKQDFRHETLVFQEKAVGMQDVIASDVKPEPKKTPVLKMDSSGPQVVTLGMRGALRCPSSLRTDCGVPQTAWALLKNYLGWSATWRDRSYFADSERMRVDYARQQDRVFWFLPSARLLIGYTPTGKGSQIFSGACNRDLGPWTKCIPPVPSGDPSTTDWLLGKVPGAEPVIVSETCQVQFDRSDLPAWTPSPDSSQKQQVLSKIRAVAERRATFFGSLKRAVVNDFNVLDPLVWSVAEVETSSGSRQRILMFIEIRSAGTGFAAVSRTEEAGKNNAGLVEKILQSGIEIW